MKFITLYNSDWPKRFDTIATYLASALPENCAYHHVGSTSVPGLAAKDVFDIDIEYRHGDLPEIVRRLKSVGYIHLGDLGISGREAFKAITGSPASTLVEHHLYACASGTFELLKHIAYRDYLIAHPHRAAWIGEKKMLADQLANTKEAYIENKSNSYQFITMESLAWANIN